MAVPIVGLSPEQAQALLRFLSNAQIVGSDAPVFMECVFALQMIATRKDDPAPAADLTAEPSLDQ